MNNPRLLTPLPFYFLQLPAIRTLGSISAGTDRQTQAVIDSGLLALCPQLLENSKVAVRKDVCAECLTWKEVLLSLPHPSTSLPKTCWTISNICAGQPDQISAGEKIV